MATKEKKTIGPAIFEDTLPQNKPAPLPPDKGRPEAAVEATDTGKPKNKKGSGANPGTKSGPILALKTTEAFLDRIRNLCYWERDQVNTFIREAVGEKMAHLEKTRELFDLDGTKIKEKGRPYPPRRKELARSSRGQVTTGKVR